VDFDSERWTKANARVLEHMGRKALMGTAYLGDLEFQDGVIEVDIAVTGGRSYPGIRFRMQDAREYEECYVRPHRAGLYPDAVQYTPVFNGISCWQLYNGEGYTAASEIAAGEWVHMKMEVLGDQARVFLGDAAEPVLLIDHLEHGVSKGGIGISSPMDGSAYFSDFAYRLTDDLEFEPPVSADIAPGIILDWDISRAFRISQVDLAEYPLAQDLGDLDWRQITGQPNGLVNVGRLMGRASREPECVLARTVLVSDTEETKEIQFGYSDWVGVFLNGEILFSGNSSYRGRDPSFLGIVGLNDALYVSLRPGGNELLLIVAESFGGWGFMCRDASAVFEGTGVSQVWETDKVFKVPESVAYDPATGVLFISNYDAYNPSRGEGHQVVSKMSLDGEILDLEWASGLNNPTGMAVRGDRLFVVERGGLAEIDTRTGEIVARHTAEGQGFLNDAAADPAGNIYVSDSRGGAIYRLEEGGLRVWLDGEEIVQPNGLHVCGGKLLIGNTGDGSLKAVGLDTGDITTVARLGEGIIDGISSDRNGDYIVSHWEGRVYKISPGGERAKILDLTGPAYKCSDFAFVPEADLLVIPAFAGNRVRAYRLGD
jgi:sugar lactone lactonase YvrE